MAAAMNEKSRVLDIIYNNNIEEMRKYLKEGGNVDFVINGEKTPLCMTRTVEMAELLLENGADIHYRGYKNITPLLAQANPGNPQIVELLLRTDPSIIHDVDRAGENALHNCVRHAYETSLQCAEILVAADPTLVTVKNNKGQTPLDIARQSNNVATQRIIDLLRRTAAGLKVASFVNKQVNKKRTLHEAWRPPNGNGNLGGNAYQALASKYANRLKTRRSKTRKSKTRKSRRY